MRALAETIDPVTARALAEGRCADPFAHLGPHLRGQRGTVTALVPGALRAWVLAEGRDPAAMAPHPLAAELFTGPLPGLGRYRLRAEDAGGACWDWDDPYCHGPVLGEVDEHLLAEGTHRELWHALGAHAIMHEGLSGVHFALWAPNARRVSVVGDFNHWNGLVHPMRRRGASGVWEIFLPGVEEGAAYKYEILGADGHVGPLRADPVGFGAEHPPATASVVRRAGREGWQDADWMAARAAKGAVDAPVSIYEVHLGSWKRVPGEGERYLSYRELAEDLVPYAADMGFTHLELLPVTEHPFDGSWGYQPVGLFSPTIRHGTPQEFAGFVEAAHRAGLGVILDWVPGHFPSDAHGLARFDGTALYEHADPREGLHRDWNTLIYNYGRREVANFLIANALYWLKDYHLDGLRVDAVASMLYRDYSRPAGEWVPNVHGGRENYEAIDFLQRMNRLAYGECPGILTAAEESTAFPGVTRPVHAGGLGFGYKWNMGWMNDTLDYFRRDPVHRRYHHNQLTFGITYAATENFILPFSHDEVVHGKGSLLGKMPGSRWDRFANLRALYGYMWGQPGKKLLFMGQDWGQEREWDHDRSLDWHLLSDPAHAGVQRLVRDLNRLYRRLPALHRGDARAEGFRWLEPDDAERSVFAWIRQGDAGDAPVVVAANLTPVPRPDYRLGFPAPGRWAEVLNTDAAAYGGGNRGNLGAVETDGTAWHGQAQSAPVLLPPLSVVMFVQGEGA